MLLRPVHQHVHACASCCCAKIMPVSDMTPTINLSQCLLTIASALDMQANTTMLTFVATICSHFLIDLAPEVGHAAFSCDNKLHALNLSALHLTGGLCSNGISSAHLAGSRGNEDVSITECRKVKSRCWLAVHDLGSFGCRHIHSSNLHQAVANAVHGTGRSKQVPMAMKLPLDMQLLHDDGVCPWYGF